MPEQRRYNNRRQQQQPYEPVGRSATGKLPPQAPELERATLGAIMIEVGAIDRVSSILKEQHFYEPAHQKIYHAIVQLSQAQKPIDMYTVTEQLLRDGALEEAGGPAYVTSLTANVSGSAHITHHARIITQKYLERELIRAASSIEEEAYNEEIDVDEQLQKAQGALFELSKDSQMRDFTRIEPVVTEALERIRAAGAKEGASGIRSGFNELDHYTSGWQKSDLIIIAARPAMGKTAFVLSMARNMAVDNHVPVAIFSLEMSNVQLTNRLIMNVCEIEGDKIRNGKLTQDEWRQIDSNIQQLSAAPIYIDDTPSLSVMELQSKARRLVQDHHVEIIIIDYLQLMNATGMSVGNRQEEVSTISRSLKGLAKELDIPVIALSQLNRGLESRSGMEGKRPVLSDLRESGAIEQDADMVVFIHRPEYYKLLVDEGGNSTLGMAEIIIAKHRNGACETVRLRFKQQYAAFLNPENAADGMADAVRNQDGVMEKAYRSKMNKDNKTAEQEFNAQSPLSGPPVDIPSDGPAPF